MSKKLTVKKLEWAEVQKTREVDDPEGGKKTVRYTTHEWEEKETKSYTLPNISNYLEVARIIARLPGIKTTEDGRQVADKSKRFEVQLADSGEQASSERVHVGYVFVCPDDNTISLDAFCGVKEGGLTVYRCEHCGKKLSSQAMRR